MSHKIEAIDGTVIEIPNQREIPCGHYSFEPLHFGEDGVRCTKCREKFSVDQAKRIIAGYLEK